jgi:putative ATPase
MFFDEKLSPLAERRRPKTLEEFVGQDHVMSEGKIVRTILDKKTPYSLILWGEPGSGKTTLAGLIADYCELEYYALSAISSGVSDVRKIIEKGRQNRFLGKQTLMFLDEIHSFNKAQQDAVLGAVESGEIILIGATTENPSFSVISPLLSRTRVIKLNPLSMKDLEQIVDSALKNDMLFSDSNLEFEEGAKESLCAMSGGDARRLLNIFETAFAVSNDKCITHKNLEEAVKNSTLYYDKAGDKHYDTISAFIKSLRGSDPDAALYYMSKMILSGEDPLFIARRMVILASEDISNASPMALNLAVSTYTAVKNIGMPEAEIILAQCAVFLASCPKSNASYMALQRAKSVASSSNHEIPMYLRNAPTELMKKMGYAKGYQYPHDYEGHFVEVSYLPEKIKDEVFYHPSGKGTEGNEKGIFERLKNLWPKKYR